MSGAAATDRPTRPGSALAFVAAAVAVGLVADHPDQLLPLAVELAGLLALGFGLWAARRDAGLAGGALALGGAAVVLVALGLGFTSPSRFSERVELLPGLVGLAVLALALLPVRASWSRRLLTAGSAAVVVCVATSGVVHGATKLPLLASMALAIVAWDVGEQSINLGEQVGRRAETTAVELVHGGASALVAGVGVVLASVVHDLQVTGVPLVGLALLLGAVLALAAALTT